MTTSEFSNQFDVLYNNIMSNQAPGLDEYEKSVFLTLAQEQLVLAYYNGDNIKLDSFEKTEEISRYLSSLVKTSELTPSEYAGTLISEDSQVFTLPNDLWFITYETAKLATSSDTCTSGKEILVVPTTQDDYYRTNENPFKRAGFRRALKLDISDNKVEIVSKYPISKYLIRYVSKLSPIILQSLSGGLSINEETTARTCSLHEALHRPILELAVRLAKQSQGIQS